MLAAVRAAAMSMRTALGAVRSAVTVRAAVRGPVREAEGRQGASSAGGAAHEHPAGATDSEGQWTLLKTANYYENPLERRAVKNPLETDATALMLEASWHMTWTC